MTIEGMAWQASAARARLKERRLTIKASAMQRVGDVMQRDELHLALPDFDGPGEYTAAMSGSRFIRVGIDTAKAKAAEETGNDSEVAKEVMSSISGSKLTMLMGAKVNITAISATEVSGTFSWVSPADANKRIENGTFRAVLRK
jgi:hypothetical protein